jgi:GxxExxY protein
MNADKKDKTKEDRNIEEINTITEKIIGCAYKVSNTLGCGFLEKVYENALGIELRKAGLHTEQQHSLQVYYNEIVVGDYIADLFVENTILVELKVVKALDVIHTAQCINYLKATGLKICLLLNFGNPRVEIKRIID